MCKTAVKFPALTAAHALLSPAGRMLLVLCIISRCSASQADARPTPFSSISQSHLLSRLPNPSLQFLGYHFTSGGYRVKTFSYAQYLTGHRCAFRQQGFFPPTTTSTHEASTPVLVTFHLFPQSTRSECQSQGRRPLSSWSNDTEFKGEGEGRVMNAEHGACIIYCLNHSASLYCSTILGT